MRRTLLFPSRNTRPMSQRLHLQGASGWRCHPSIWPGTISVSSRRSPRRTGSPARRERLGVNHSTVFRRLGQLEEELGVKLFERHRTGYALTAAGEEMAALAERMEEDVATFARKLAGQAVSPAGELRVTTNDTLLVHLLTPIFARFTRSCPDVRLDVVLANQALNLSKRDADVAIRATDNPPETLVGRRVATIAWAIYGARRGLPAARRRRSRRASPSAPGWRSATTSPASKAARFVRDRVAPERIVYKVNTVLGLAEAVESGIGIGPLPCFIADARPGPRAPVAAEPGFLHRPVAPDPSGPAPIGAGARLHGLHGGRDRQAAQG